MIGGNGPPGLAINPTEADSLTGKPILTPGPRGLPERAERDRPRRGRGREGRLQDRRQGRAGDAGPAARPEDQAHRAGRVRVRWPERRHLDGLRHQSSCRRPSSAAGTCTARSRSTRPRASRRTSSRRRRRRCCPRGSWRGRATPTSRRTRRASTRSSGSCRPSCWSSRRSRSSWAAFIIINTFSILVAQRSRELALLRAMGASRRQVNRSVLLEAVAVGLLGSTVGLGVGYLLALGLRWLFGVFGLDLSRADFPMTWSAVVAVVRRRRGHHGGRGAAARAPRLADRSDGGAARRRGPAGVDGAATRRDRHGAGAGGCGGDGGRAAW